MDAGNWARVEVIGEVAEHNPIHQKRSQVLREDELQSALDALRGEKIKVGTISQQQQPNTRHFIMLKLKKNSLDFLAVLEWH